jgi:hypothetical protein
MDNRNTLLLQISNLGITLLSAIITPILIAHLIGLSSMRLWIVVTSLSSLISLFNVNSAQVVSHFLFSEDNLLKFLHLRLWLLHLAYTLLICLVILCISAVYFYTFHKQDCSRGIYISLIVTLSYSVNVFYEPFAGLSFVNKNYSSFLLKQVIFRFTDICIFVSGLVLFLDFNFLPFYLLLKLIFFLIIFRFDFQNLSRIESKGEYSFRNIFNMNSKRIKSNFKVSATNWFRFQYLNVFLSSLLSVAIFGNFSILRTLSSGLRQISESILTSFSQQLLHARNNSDRLLAIGNQIRNFITLLSIPSYLSLCLLFTVGPNLLGSNIRIPIHLVILAIVLGLLEIQNSFYLNLSSILDQHFEASKFRFQNVLLGSIISSLVSLIFHSEFFLIGQVISEYIFLNYQRRMFRKEMKL